MENKTRDFSVFIADDICVCERGRTIKKNRNKIRREPPV